MEIERIVPGTKEWEQYYENHICRYKFAGQRLQFSGSNTVLDVACGVGYGTYYLAPFVNRKIIGADISKDAINEAKKRFSNPKIEYIKDDAQKPRLLTAFAPFDAIVSFETLEHLKQPDLFLASCYQLLKPGGEFVVSSPNGSFTSPTGEVKWKYHEKEYTAEEMITIIEKAGFSDVELFGQQWTQIGKLKNLLRSELHVINSNPFMRLGRWFQNKIKARSFSATLPERTEDIEVVGYPNALGISSQKTEGPFVIIITCKKK